MKLELRLVTVATLGARDARRSWPERHCLLLRLTDAEGRSGVGEASPLPGYSRETLDDVQHGLRRVSVPRLASLLELDWSWATLSSVGELAANHLPSARMALETAALDLWGQRTQTAAPALLGAEVAATRHLAQLLGPASSPTLLHDARAALDVGYGCLKVKLGAPGALAAELAGLVALREHVGPHVSLRVDANGAWGAAELSHASAALRTLAIELFEEPGAALPAGLPLALDESLQGASLEAAADALHRQKPRALVLKPMALGGLSHCFELARRARALGAEAVVSHCFDGPFAWRATAALALALPQGLAHGLAPHAGLEGWHARPLPIERAVLHGWTEPGLGTPAEHDWT